MHSRKGARAALIALLVITLHFLFLLPLFIVNSISFLFLPFVHQNAELDGPFQCPTSVQFVGDVRQEEKEADYLGTYQF